jgi:hypothetical protein
LFLVTVIVALAVGWWVEHRGRIEKTEHAESAQDTAEFLAEVLNARGSRITVHPDGALSGQLVPTSDARDPIPLKP